MDWETRWGRGTQLQALPAPICLQETTEHFTHRHPANEDNRPRPTEMPVNITRHAAAVPVHEALEASPTLAHLSRLARQSSARMALVRPVLPRALQALVHPGAPEADTWCLLAPHAAGAAKLRQLMPAMLRALEEGGESVRAIRIKVMQPR